MISNVKVEGTGILIVNLLRSNQTTMTHIIPYKVTKGHKINQEFYGTLEHVFKILNLRNIAFYYD